MRYVSCQALFFAIRRKSLQHKGIKIEILSRFRRNPTFEIFANAASNSLRRKEFGKIGASGQIELRPILPACLR
jgi:hypothetical protein